MHWTVVVRDQHDSELWRDRIAASDKYMALVDAHNRISQQLTASQLSAGPTIHVFGPGTSEHEALAGIIVANGKALKFPYIRIESVPSAFRSILFEESK